MPQLRIGSRVFPSKKAAHHAVQHILNTTPLESFLSGDDRQLLLDLVHLHPNAQFKIGTGIRDIRVALNQPPYCSRCFLIYRVDGSTTDFSYLRCFNQSHKQRVLQAFRIVINPQIQVFLSSISFPTICALTGTSIVCRDDCDIDHADPPFIRLVNDWLAEADLTFDDIELESEDNHVGPQLSRPAHGLAFQRYHHTYAKLRVVGKEAHHQRNAQQFRETLPSISKIYEAPCLIVGCPDRAVDTHYGYCDKHIAMFR